MDSAPITAPPLTHAASGHRPTDLNRRFAGVDGLRGVAAAAVVVYHFTVVGSFAGLFHRALPGAAVAAVQHLNLGVHVFFVISGFVIAHGVRDQPITGRYVANFAARRCLRLDPPYLCAIALTIVLLVASNRAMTARTVAVPSVADVLLNVFYLSDVTHRGFMVVVFWTLALEVQFYLLFILTLWASTRIATVARHVIGRPVSVAHVAAPLLGGWAALSLAIEGGWVAPWPGWFVNQWYLFVLGAMVSGVVAKRLSFGWLAAYVAAVWVAALHHPDGGPVAGLATAAVIGWTATRPTSTPVLGSWPVQFLGRISYSLYLIHVVVGSRLLNLAVRRWGDSAAAAAVALPAAVAASIGVAWLMFRFVEQPGIRAGRRLKMRHEYAAGPTTPPAAAT